MVGHVQENRIEICHVDWLGISSPGMKGLLFGMCEWGFKAIPPSEGGDAIQVEDRRS
jgi:hypothetical protein